MSTVRKEQQLAEYLLNLPLCIFCNEFHKSENCEEVRSTVDRIEILLIKELCLVCMSHHTSFYCPRREMICSLCNKMNHHVAICYLKDKPAKDGN
uniref:TAZ-type domain-containing protein n=1 Tax=Caenorhabditis tropicalis TaxID=1561998 RepID=A0A1I7UQD0_9PELO